MTNDRLRLLNSREQWSCELLEKLGIDTLRAAKVVISFVPDELVSVDVTYQAFDAESLETVRKHLSLVHVADADQQLT